MVLVCNGCFGTTVLRYYVTMHDTRVLRYYVVQRGVDDATHPQPGNTNNRNLSNSMAFIEDVHPYITLHTLLTFPTGFFNDNLHQIKLFKTNVSNNLKVIYKLDRREKLYVLFTVVIYKVSNIVTLQRYVPSIIDNSLHFAIVLKG